MMQSVGFLVGEWIRKGLKEGNVNTLIVLLIFDQIDKLEGTTTQNGRRGISNNDQISTFWWLIPWTSNVKEYFSCTTWITH